MQDPVNTPIKLIGVGDFGGKIAEDLARYYFQRYDFAVVNTHQHWQPTGLVKEWHMIGSMGTSGSPLLGKRAAEKHLPLLEKMLGRADTVVFIAGLGGGTGTGATPVLAEAAAKLGKQVAVFLTFPLSAGSNNRVIVANQALDKLQAYNVQTQVLYMEDWVKPGDEITYFDDLYAKIRTELLGEIEKFLRTMAN